jgi:hypothetical protein
VGNGNFENLRLGTIAMRGQNEAARHDIGYLNPEILPHNVKAKV